MAEIHFYYTALGISSGNVEISVSYDRLLLRREHDYDFERRDTVQSSESPRRLLEKLEKLVVDKTGVKPSHRDIVPSDCEDDLEYRDYPRHFGYLPADTWSGLGSEEEDPKEREEVDDRNQKLHPIALQAYEEFISGLQ